MKVLLIDDHPLVHAALSAMLHSLQPNLQLHCVTGPDEAFERIAAEPELRLVLLDLLLGEDIDGFAVLRRLRAEHPGLAVVVVSATERLADVVRAVDMGAMGFVPKRSDNGSLLQALRMALAGSVYIPPVLLDLITRMQRRGDLGDTTITGAQRLLAAEDAAAADAAASRAAAAPAGAPAPAATRRPPLPAALSGVLAGLVPRRADGLDVLGLTPRQTDVLALLLKGLPNKLIAREMNLSVETIKDHVAALLRTLEVTSRTQAVLAVGRLLQQAQDGDG